MLAFHLITFAWPFLPHLHRGHRVASQITIAVDEDGIGNMSNETIDIMHTATTLATTTTMLGCNATRFEWCRTLTAVNPWLYYVTYAIFIGLSFPLITLTTNTLFR